MKCLSPQDFLSVVLGIKPRASYMPGKHIITELHTQTIEIIFQKIKSLFFFKFIGYFSLHILLWSRNLQPWMTSHIHTSNPIDAFQLKEASEIQKAMLGVEVITNGMAPVSALGSSRGAWLLELTQSRGRGRQHIFRTKPLFSAGASSVLAQVHFLFKNS